LIVTAATQSLTNTGHSLESSTALFEYLDVTARSPGQVKSCSADVMMTAMQEINLTASVHKVRYEDALVFLTTKMKSFLDHHTRTIETQTVEDRKRITEEITLSTGIAFDAEEQRKEEEEALLQKQRQAEAEAAAIYAKAKRTAEIHTMLSGQSHNFQEINEPHIVGAAHQPWRLCINGNQTAGGPFKIPDTWATHFEEGKIPFLPCCPVCSKGNTIITNCNVITGNVITEVKCNNCSNNNYKWEASTGKHYKWASYVPPTYTRLTDGSLWPSPPPAHLAVGSWKVWDPKDPDGSIAAKAAREKEIVELEEQLKALQARITTLKGM
jgi:hypothetical protein